MATTHDLANAQQELLRRRQAEGVNYRPTLPKVERFELPSSEAIPRVQRTNAILSFVTWLVNMQRARLGLPAVDHFGNVTGPEPETVKAFGYLLAAIQQRQQERVGQLWLLMRYLDKRGSGRLTYDAIYELNYTSRVNLRRIIRDGIKAGYFWREGDSLAYAGEARLCARLGIERVKGWAVAIPVVQLREPDIVKLRALFLDAYHSGRGDGFANPIARGGWRHNVGIKQATGRTRPTQRRYEQRRGITVRPNFEDLGEYTADNLAQRLAEGYPAFVMKMKGGARIVQRLSNAYAGTFRTVKRGRRWLNRRIKAIVGGESRLCKHTCNDTTRTIKRYYATAKRAANAKETVDGVPIYGWLRETPTGGAALWQRVVV